MSIEKEIILTVGMRLSSQRLTPLYSIRNAVQEYASKKGIDLGSLRGQPKETVSEGGIGTDRYGPLDEPGHCLSIVTSRGVSAYDVAALSRQERTLISSAKRRHALCCVF